MPSSRCGYSTRNGEGRSWWGTEPAAEGAHRPQLGCLLPEGQAALARAWSGGDGGALSKSLLPLQ